MFWRRPAPVQVAWLGYAGTTGLPTVDWRITDSFIDPPGATEAFNSERLMQTAAHAMGLSAPGILAACE